jgi:hypothetical protein
MHVKSPTLRTAIVATDPAHAKRAQGRVRLEGQLKKPAATTGAGAYATLPAGYRPAVELRVPVAVWNQTDSTYISAIAKVATDGTIVVTDLTGADLATAKECHIYLHSIQFSV